MSVATSCPDPAVLVQLALGGMAPEAIEPLAQHVEQCERCTQALDTLKTRDTLVEALAA